MVVEANSVQQMEEMLDKCISDLVDYKQVNTHIHKYKENYNTIYKDNWDSLDSCMKIPYRKYKRTHRKLINIKKKHFQTGLF